MRNKTLIIVVFAIGIVFIITGALFKVLHWGFGEEAWINGNTILATGLALKVMALSMFVIGYVTGNKNHEV